MSGLPNVNDTVRRLNPQIFGTVADAHGIIAETVAKSAKRIRQSSQPLENKLEREFREYLERQYPTTRIYPQALKFRICNGVAYTPDLVAFLPEPTVWEIKGKKIFDGSVEKLKTAASMYPDFTWWLAWKKDGVWCLQKILP